MCGIFEFAAAIVEPRTPAVNLPIQIQNNYMSAYGFTRCLTDRIKHHRTQIQRIYISIYGVERDTRQKLTQPVQTVQL
jgi:hypothetical protein